MELAEFLDKGPNMSSTDHPTTSVPANHAPKRAPTIAVFSERNLFREGLSELLRKLRRTPVIEATTTEDLLRGLRRQHVPLVLIDLECEQDDPRKILDQIHEVSPNTSVVTIGSTLQNAALARAASGWLETPGANAASLDRIAFAAVQPHQGHLRFRQSARLARERRAWEALSTRQQQVLELLSLGADNLKIAAGLDVSERAVKAHVSELLRKFGADNRAELAVLGTRAGLRGTPLALEHLSKAASRTG
jgi:two-component system nitrate/nitrite response regulator NarL